MFKPVIFVTLAALVALPSVAAEVVVELRPDATVAGPVYRLKDIARIIGGNHSARTRLAEIEIGVAPRPGHTDRLSRNQVGRLIEANMPEWRGKLQWRGSKASVVRTIGIAQRQRLTQTAEDFLRAELANIYTRVDVAPVDAMREVTLPPAAELRPRPINGNIASRTAVWIDISVDGRAYGAVPVWFSVQAWKPVPIARMDLAAGSELRADDFVLEEWDMAHTAKFMDRLPEGDRLRLRTAIARGSAVPVNALESTPAISRNQQVAVRIKTGSIVIETAGIAQANGRIGETVKVKNTNSSESFLAQVLAPGVVSVNVR